VEGPPHQTHSPSPTMLQGVGKLRDEGMALDGHTIILVDVSGSMSGALSSKSTLNRADAAGAMAILLREVSADVSVFDYNDQVREVPARHGFALRDAIRRPSGGTLTGAASQAVLKEVTRRLGRSPERIVVITDEQSLDNLPALPTGTKGYVMNVAPYQNGIAWGVWTTISGFSENLVKFMVEVEAQSSGVDNPA
jgi:60 kDa SS-A/Ro ribonucleoprotein